MNGMRNDDDQWMRIMMEGMMMIYGMMGWSAMSAAIGEAGINRPVNRLKVPYGWKNHLIIYDCKY